MVGKPDKTENAPVGHGRIREETFARVKAVALQKVWQCISESYDYGRQKLWFRCSEGHEFLALPTDLLRKKREKGCLLCWTASRRKGTLEKMRAIAKERGGECLTVEHLKAKDKFRFRCSEGHEWPAHSGAIRGGTWCEKCSNRNSRGEQLTRLIFEAIFETQFPKARPKWLRSSSGVLLELDGYSEKMGLAFEYQGQQHYGHEPLFHRTKSFERQEKRDEEKRLLVKNSSIKILLIEIPFFRDNKTVDEAVQFIKNILLNQGVEFDDREKISIDPSALYSGDLKAKVEKIITKRGGSLLSEGVLGSTIKVKVECKNGHKWDVTPSKLENGRWCDECRREKQSKDMLLSIDVYHAKAKERKGRFLSTENLGVGVKHEWECHIHGSFKATPRDVLFGKNGGTWCPKCGQEKSRRTRRDHTFESVKAYAINLGGNCLSESYDSGRQKLRFRCSCGHEWLCLPVSMLNQETWCNKCSSKRGGFAVPGAKTSGFAVKNCKPALEPVSVN